MRTYRSWTVAPAFVTPLLVALCGLGCGSDVAVTPKANLKPAVQILGPESGSTVADDEVVELFGSVVDGNGAGDLQLLSWSSSLDGVLDESGLDTLGADGTTLLPTMLSEGLHTVTLEAVDREGLRDSASITITVELAEQLPTAIIDAPANLSEVTVGQPVGLVGTVWDPNEEAADLVVQWDITPASGGETELLDAEGPTESGATTSDWLPLAEGNVVVRLTVEDADGNTAFDEVGLFAADPALADEDGDGVTVGDGDCDDSDPLRFPGNDELCDGVDNDCDELLLDGEDVDSDGDGSPECDDCDDSDPLVKPDAVEICNGLDDNCTTFADDGEGTCPCEVTHFGVTPYQVCTDAAVSWEDAVTGCAADPGYILVAISGQLENDFVYSVVGTAMGASPGTYVWLGGTDEDSEGAWRWHNAEPWVFTNWAPDTGFGAEPNNSGGVEHYLEMGRTANSEWNDVAASSRNFYVCEFDPT